MISGRAFIALILVACPGGPAASQEVVTWNDDVSGWYIGVDTTVENGCFMTAGYDGGTVLRAGFLPDEDVFAFYVGNAGWESLESGKLYPVSVEFGNKGPWTGEALGTRLGELPMLRFLVGFEEGRADLFIEEFMRMTVVDVQYQGSSLASLRLTGTFAAAQEMIRCQSSIFENMPATDPFRASGDSSNDPFR